MIRIAEHKIVPARQSELQQLGWWRRRRLALHAERRRCRFCGSVPAARIAQRLGYTQQFTERALFGLGFVPVALGIGLGCCCDDEPQTLPCANCLDGVHGIKVLITISGVVPGSNYSCPGGYDQNVAYELPFGACSGGTASCSRSLSFTASITPNNNPEWTCFSACVAARVESTSLRVYVLHPNPPIAGGAQNKQFRDTTWTPDQDCLTIDRDIPFFFQSADTHWDYSGATCHWETLT